MRSIATVLTIIGLTAFLPFKAHAYGTYEAPSTYSAPQWAYGQRQRPFTGYEPYRHRRHAHTYQQRRQARYGRPSNHLAVQMLGYGLSRMLEYTIRHPATRQGQVVSHPSGCPSRAFCGCGVSVRVFGHSVRDLWLARNWHRFPSAAPAAGMVVIFGNHHVAYIESYHGNGLATLYDPNSGGHATRVHMRSIVGLRVVDPHGGYGWNRRQHSHYARAW